MAGGGCRFTRLKRKTQLANVELSINSPKKSALPRAEAKRKPINWTLPILRLGTGTGTDTSTILRVYTTLHEMKHHAALCSVAVFGYDMPMIGHAYAKRVRRSGLRSLGGLTMTLGSSRSWSTSQVDRKVEEFRD